MPRTSFNIFLLFCLILSASGQQAFDEKMKSLYKGTVPLIYAEEFSKIADNQNVIILDTRESEEYAVSHIRGARLVSYDDFEPSRLSDIDKSTEVIVYCSVGYRSERVGEKLIEMGYGNVKNLYGGIFDWKNKGFTVVNSRDIPTDSVHTYNASWSQWLYNGIKVYE